MGESGDNDRHLHSCHAGYSGCQTAELWKYWSKGIWGASGVTCEMGVLGIHAPATVCTSSLPATPAPAQVWKGVLHGTAGTGRLAAVHVVWGLLV